MTDEEREDLNTFKHDLVKQARWWQWKAETLEKENEQLKFENAALRKRLENAEYRAVLMERALYDKCYEIAGIGMPFNCNREKCELEMNSPCYRETATSCFMTAAIKQAEKELAEERK